MCVTEREWVSGGVSPQFFLCPTDPTGLDSALLKEGASGWLFAMAKALELMSAR